MLSYKPIRLLTKVRKYIGEDSRRRKTDWTTSHQCIVSIRQCLPRNQRKTNFLNFKLLRRTAKYKRKSTTLNTEIIRIIYQELRNNSQTQARCFRFYLDICIFEICFTTLKSWTFLSRYWHHFSLDAISCETSK